MIDLKGSEDLSHSEACEVDEMVSSDFGSEGRVDLGSFVRGLRHNLLLYLNQKWRNTHSDT